MLCIVSWLTCASGVAPSVAVATGSVSTHIGASSAPPVAVRALHSTTALSSSRPASSPVPPSLSTLLLPTHQTPSTTSAPMAPLGAYSNGRVSRASAAAPTALLSPAGAPATSATLATKFSQVYPGPLHGQTTARRDHTALPPERPPHSSTLGAVGAALQPSASVSASTTGVTQLGLRSAAAPAPLAVHSSREPGVGTCCIACSSKC